ncbi:HECT-like ubiquitin-conjugating enzyme-binding-domain-containing protein [Phakopsora pachyrhizi]|uniref:HECT-like ubiquitin-conjugating enzyme-binding-domain-containing protein n=1 Tax=Phakopsora pachyrhizi TaxID=170000 RepID=A0AAV0BLG3_PHAPC|nr:HECT-like ubiquitin-conjugating enzyme-binding-domain-containing protein [Phakopsora pachyrhizi]
MSSEAEGRHQTRYLISIPTKITPTWSQSNPDLHSQEKETFFTSLLEDLRTIELAGAALPNRNCSNLDLEKVRWEWALEEQIRIGRVKIWLIDSKLCKEDNLTKGDDDDCSDGFLSYGKDRVGIKLESDSVIVRAPTVDLMNDGNDKLKRIEISVKCDRLDRLEDSMNDLNDRFSARILNLISSRGIGIRLNCVGCDQTIVSLNESERSIRWFALPSEDWQDFIEYWICHDEGDHDQTDGSKNITKITARDESEKRAKGVNVGIGKIRDPKEYEGFIGDLDLRFDRDWIESSCYETGWRFTRKESDGDGVDEERREIDGKKIIKTIPERVVEGSDLRKRRLDCKSCSIRVGELERSGMSELVKLYKRVLVIRTEGDEERIEGKTEGETEVEGSNRGGGMSKVKRAEGRKEVDDVLKFVEEGWDDELEGRKVFERMIVRQMNGLNLLEGIHKFLICEEESEQIQLADQMAERRPKKVKMAKVLYFDRKSSDQLFEKIRDLKYSIDHIDRLINVLVKSRFKYLINEVQDEVKLRRTSTLYRSVDESEDLV